MSARDSIRVTTVVPLPVEAAFRAFTEDVDQWWRRGPRFRAAGSKLFFEPGVGGRFVELDPDGSEHLIGRVRVWEVGERLVFSWRARTFEGDEHTEVEVGFFPDGAGTRVTLEHRGFATLRPDHPALFGTKRGPDFAGIMGLYWADLLQGLAQVTK